MAETRPTSVKNIQKKQRTTKLKHVPSWSSTIQFFFIKQQLLFYSFCLSQNLSSV